MAWQSKYFVAPQQELAMIINGCDEGGTAIPARLISGTVSATEIWRAAGTASETSNDSDVSFTVPAAQEWQVQSVWAELITTADVGNRQMTVEIQDAAADVMAAIKAGATQAASGTVNYLFGVGVSDLTAVRSTSYMMTPLVPWVLPAGYVVRVYDSAAIAGTADDMVVQLMYLYRGV